MMRLEEILGGSMEIRFDGDRLTLDGIIDVTKDGNDYSFDCGYHNIKVTSPFSDGMQKVKQYTTEPKIEYDPHNYQNGNNGLTVKASVQRALDTIAGTIWEDFDEDTLGSYTLMEELLTTIIKDGLGRHYAYTIAGSIKKDIAIGRFKGVPLSLLFYGIVKDYIPERKEEEYPPPGTYTLKNIFLK